MWLQQLLALVLGVSFLHVFFRAVESKWPVSYAALSSGPDYAISRNIVRYLLFRLGPVAVTVVYAAVTLGRADAPVVVPGTGIGLVHGLVTSGRAEFELIRRHQVQRRPLVAVMHPTIVLLVTVVALGAASAARRFDAVVPAANDVVSSLWIGLIAGVIGSYLGRLTQGAFVEMEAIFTASRRSIPAGLWDAVTPLAERHGADPQLVRAVMLVENIQRPRWFRRLERFVGRFVGRGTYGILQVRAERPVSDLDSLELALQAQFRGLAPVARPDGGIDYAALKSFAHAYNPDPKFEELLSYAYSFVGKPR